MDFVKVEGLGNDFIVVDREPDAELIPGWCDRHTGIGADGVLLLEPIDEGRIAMRYWNADGGEVEMCGNGLRALAVLAVVEGMVEGKDFVVQSPVGDHPVSVLGDGMVRAFVGTPHAFRTEELTVAGHTVRPVGVGNPHAVLFVDDVEEAPVSAVGPQIAGDPLFPEGANVEFVERGEEDRVKVRVWERGVGETTGSGTGAAAAAYAAREAWELGDRIVVEVPGGELLIEFDDAGAWMTGPASVVYRGSIEANPGFSQ
jgi:diaminopimelate epimerase